MANQYYQEAIVCGDAGELDDAIEGYTKAIEEFPLFYEAIDNRAFCYMEKGDYESALLGFEESLAINPDGIHAYFSRGECLLKLRRYDEAEEVFVSGKGKFPEHRGEFGKFLLKTKLSRTADSRLTEIQGRPWWKLW
ncbi:MAG: tetratricopeptide repeat protein [Candidatus Hydrogenedentes bacterium]|nr:tetratricopeptide repeat protein [Candidatus Hydrogenedentota bacterium]